MKKFLLVFCALTCYFQLLTSKSFASTTIPAGLVSGSWTLAGSPYLIQGNIQINSGVTLTIDPGVTVEFQGHYKLTMKGCIVAAGTASDSITFTSTSISTGWAGIVFSHTSSANDTSKFLFCKILYSKNSAGVGGTALRLDTYSKAVISNSRISNCSSTAIVLGNITSYADVVLITNNMISYNAGGGIKSFFISNLLINNNIIRNNSGMGGILCGGGSPVITNNTIIYNSSTADASMGPGFGPMGGGGISYDLAAYGCGVGTPVISDNLVTNNSVPNGLGGGIYCDGVGSVNGNIVLNNTAAGGGGISAPNSQIFNNTISNNTASSMGGGGIYCGNATGSSSIYNNTVTNNNANNGGGVYCFNGSSPVIINNSIANNNAQNGGALYCAYNSSPTITNCIFYGNTASVRAPQVFLETDDCDPNFYFCDLQGGTGSIDANNDVYTGIYTSNINANPLFVAPSGGSGIGFNGSTANWSLQATSPCINTGDPNGTYPNADKAGNIRVTVCRIDMGAYEYQNGTPFSATISQTQQILCNGDNTGEAVVALLGGGTPYTYVWNTSPVQTNDTATGLVAGTYSVTVTESSYGCSITKTITISQPSAIIFTTTKQDVTNCLLVNNGSISVAATGGSGALEYSKDGGSNYQSSNAFNGLVVNTYPIVVKDNNGCITSLQNVVIDQTPSTLSSSVSVNSTSCNANSGSAIVTPSGGAFPYSYLWSNNNTTNQISNLAQGTYSVNVTDANSCTVTDMAIIQLSNINSLTQPICLVTVDTFSTHNIIIWQKPTTASIDSFKIYRVVAASIDTLVGTVAYNALSEFHDYSCDPNVTQYDYKISVLDTCGNEGVKSAIHRTILMTTSLGFNQVNLNWNQYVGNTVNQYHVWRDSTFTGNWQLLASLSPASTTYIDNNWPGTGGWRYRIDVDWVTSCTPTAKTMASAVNTTRSNTKDNYRVTGLSPINAKDVSLFPNPASELINVSLNANAYINQINILDAMGRLVKVVSSTNKNTVIQINTFDLAKGIYFIEINTNVGIVRKSFVRE